MWTEPCTLRSVPQPAGSLTGSGPPNPPDKTPTHRHTHTFKRNTNEDKPFSIHTGQPDMFNLNHTKDPMKAFVIIKCMTNTDTVAGGGDLPGDVLVVK